MPGPNEGEEKANDPWNAPRIQLSRPLRLHYSVPRVTTPQAQERDEKNSLNNPKIIRGSVEMTFDNTLREVRAEADGKKVAQAAAEKAKEAHAIAQAARKAAEAEECVTALTQLKDTAIALASRYCDSNTSAQAVGTFLREIVKPEHGWMILPLQKHPLTARQPNLTAINDCLLKSKNFTEFLAGFKEQRILCDMGLVTKTVMEIKDAIDQDTLTKKTKEQLVTAFGIADKASQHIADLKDEDCSKRITWYKNALCKTPPITEELEDPILKRLRQQLTNEKNLSKQQSDQTILLFLFRETLYRTQGVFVNDEQLVAVLDASFHGGNLVSGINADQNKKIYIDLLHTAMLWAEGTKGPIVCLKDMASVKHNLPMYQKFFKAIGSNGHFISNQNAFTDYHPEDVHCTILPEWSLYKQKMRLNGTPIDCSEVPLLLAGSDSLLDDAAYIVSSVVPEGEANPDEWIYPLVNDVVDFLDNQSNSSSTLGGMICLYNQRYPGREKNTLTINEEVNFLFEYLSEQARSDVNHQARLKQEGIRFTLNKWIISARLACDLEEHTDYQVVKYANPQKGERYFRAEILDKSKLNQWSDGVHQLLHARLQAAERTFQFPCEHEVVAESISNNTECISEHVVGGGRLVCTTHTPLSDMQVRELRSQYDMDVHLIPGRVQNTPTQETIPNAVQYKQQQRCSAILHHVEDYLDKIEAAFRKKGYYPSRHDRKAGYSRSSYQVMLEKRKEVLTGLHNKWAEILAKFPTHLDEATYIFKRHASDSLRGISDFAKDCLEESTPEIPNLDDELAKRHQAVLTHMEKTVQPHATRMSRAIIKFFENHRGVFNASSLRHELQTIYHDPVHEKDRVGFQRYRDENNEDSLENTIKTAINSFTEYKKHWSVSGDRAREAENLIRKWEENKLRVNPSNPFKLRLSLSDLLEDLNSRIVETFNDDQKLDRCWWRLARRFKSEFRERMTAVKSLIFIVCPEDQLEDLFEKELTGLGKFTKALSDRLTSLGQQTSVTPLISQLNTTLQSMSLSSQEKIIQARYYLGQIFAHPDYDDNKTNLSLLDEHLELLSTIAIGRLGNEAEQKQAVMTQSLRAAALQLDVAPSWRMRFTDFFSSAAARYQIKEDVTKLPFARVLPDESDPQARYYTYQALKHMHNALTDDGKALNVRYSEGESRGEIQVNFSQLGSNLVTFNYEVIYKMQNKKLLVTQSTCKKVDEDYEPSDRKSESVKEEPLQVVPMSPEQSHKNFARSRSPSPLRLS